MIQSPEEVYADLIVPAKTGEFWRAPKNLPMGFPRCTVDGSAVGVALNAASPHNHRSLLEAGIIILTSLSLYYTKVNNRPAGRLYSILGSGW
jgi:hypothetical protein